MKGYLSMFDLPERITAEYYDSVEMFTVESIWQLCDRNLSEREIDISSEEELSELCFDTGTVFPHRLQEMAEHVLQDGKRNMLNTCGLTGKGIKVAMIDKPIRQDHIEFEGRLEYIEVLPGHPDNEDTYFHGTTCAGLMSGATCGVAPESELVFFAIPNKTDNLEEYWGFQLEALKKIIEYNHKNESPIRVVCLPAGFAKSQLEQRSELEKQLLETGCVLIDAMNFGRNFKGIDYVKNNDKIEYKLNKWQIDDFERNKHRDGFVEYFNSVCFVPSPRRTAPGDYSNTEFIHWSKAASESWTMPQVAGAYACCLQDYPTFQFEDFIKKCKSCPKKDGFTILDLKKVLE